MHRFIREPHAALAALFAEQGDCAHFKLGARQYQLFAGPDEINAILVEHVDDFDDTDLYRALARRLGDGEASAGAWREQREAVLPLFTQSALAAYEPALIHHTNVAFVRWDAAARNDEGIDLLGELRQLALEFVLAELLGVDPNTYTDLQELLSLLSLLEDFYDLPTHLGLYEQPKLTPKLERLTELLDALITNALARPDERDDFITLLARTEWICESDPELAHASLRESVAALLFESVGPTASAMFWILQQLASRPEVLARVEAGSQAKLDAAIHESLRLYPPVWWITREAEADTQIGSRQVAAGTIVLVSALITHRHPKLWPEPNAFRLERFLGVPEVAFRTIGYFPFGYGRRTCMGARLALREIEVVLSRFIRRYRFESVFPGPLELANTLTLLPRETIPFTLALRN